MDILPTAEVHPYMPPQPRRGGTQRPVELPAELTATAPTPRFYKRNLSAPELRRKTGIISQRMPMVELPE